MLIRRTLQVALLALVSATVLTFLWNVSLGVDEPTVGTIVASYIAWGRWAETATVLVMAALLVAIPLLPGTRRAAHVIVSGAVLVIVGDLVDLSRFEGPDLVELVRLNAVPADLVAGRGFEVTMQSAPTYVSAVGILFVGVGLFILAADSEGRTWIRASRLLGTAFSTMALTEIMGATTVSWLLSWVGLGTLFYWLLIANRTSIHISERDSEATQQHRAPRL